MNELIASPSRQLDDCDWLAFFRDLYRGFGPPDEAFYGACVARIEISTVHGTVRWIQRDSALKQAPPERLLSSAPLPL
jgi:hypothetical protein